jgi:Pyruvate/2-oxoacid:ferredoxin oxidoreductase delta subunit
MLLDLQSIVPTKLTLMDGIIGMEGPGPQSGTPKKMGYILVSENNLAIDYVFSKITGFKEKEIPLMQCAKERNIVGSNFQDIQFTNLKFNDIKTIKFKKPKRIIFIPKKLRRISKYLFVPKPVINYKKCVSCYKCMEICPNSAISKNTNINKPKINYKECIRCFCCHEICPYHSIDAKHNFFSLIFKSKIK